MTETCKHCALPIREVESYHNKKMIWAHAASVARVIADSLIERVPVDHRPEPVGELSET